MKAIVAHGKQDLRVDEVSDPGCGADQVIIEVDHGGICGSDLHYWMHGATGLSILREPMILGHEVAGRIVDVGVAVTGLRSGQLVTPHPSPACRGCPPELAASTAYLGSAGTMPHTQGAFARYKALSAYQIRILPDGMSTRLAALTEPLAVALHAVTRAGSVVGKTVLVSGAGPIGNLVVAALRAAGAAHVSASDIQPFALQLARESGADETIDLSIGQQLPTGVDIVFEASAASVAVGACLAAARRGGTMIQVGNLPPGDITIALAALVSREIDYRGTFRFREEIVDAIAALSAGLRVEHLITHTYGVDDALAAFATAADKTISSKVLIDFG